MNASFGLGIYHFIVMLAIIFALNLCCFVFLLDCKSFMETFQEVAESQKKEDDDEETSAAAGLIEKLSVEEKADAEKKDEEKPEDKKTGEQESAPGEESKADGAKKVEEPTSSA